ncbi:MAG: response regulator transcription factor [Methylococcaceae bacterium]|nr:response regulator transcription factor [Methylococcaceae bacterium]
MTNDTHAIVMIVDDTPNNLAVLSDTLSEAGYRVLVATDGLSALEQIAYLKPDIILLDVIMPGIDGFETCKRLKADPTTAAIPVIFMTARSELEDLLHGFDQGAVDYVVKPIRPPEVLVRVETQLKQVKNMQRAENALNNNPYATLAFNKSGYITWLPTAGHRWLEAFLQSPSEALNVGALLPAPIIDWVKRQLAIPDHQEQSAFESIRNGVHFSAKFTVCINTDEYLLLLEKHSGEWDLDSVKASLGLTFREAEILMWISRGKTNKEVGLILDTSPRTVNKHLEHIFEKLGVVTRAAAVSIAMQRTSNLR